MAAWAATAQTIPNAGQWTLEGNPVESMISGMERYLDRVRPEIAKQRKPSVEKLGYALGVVDKRVGHPPERTSIGETHAFKAEAIRWPVLDNVSAEGVHLIPKQSPHGCVIAVPDAGQAPEDFAAVAEFAAAGYQVVSPVLLDLDSSYSGKPSVRMSKIPHREWIYRMSFPVGRHPIGYEVQKVLAAVDWLTTQTCPSIAVHGVGEGAWIAQFAAMLDDRISAVDLRNASIEPESLRDQPVHRNVFGLMRDFGDAEIRNMLGARLQRIPRSDAPAVPSNPVDRKRRMERQVREIEHHVQTLVRDSRRVRDQLWSKIPGATAEEWRTNAEPLAQRFLHDVIGVLPPERVPLNLRVRASYDDVKWRGYEVQFDVRPEFFAYGVLLIPKDLKPGERRPVVVVQHGLNGRPQVFFQQTQGRELDVYRNFAAQFADRGYIVYMPQNPYTGEFRHLAKMANPLGLSFYSLIKAQYDVMLDWLVLLPFVDADRVGFYGLSYGGKTALRIPPFDARYKVVVCGGDFNEWIVKLTTPDEPWSYVYTVEYEILEWNMAHVANHAELAILVAPRRFMVERGHRDGVGIDEWVSYEYARVRRFFDEKGIPERTSIAYFNGPHRVDGPAALAFLRDALGR
jgi:dienelactone hydrolase